MTPTDRPSEQPTVGDVMSSDIAIVMHTDTMAVAARALRERGELGAPVVDDEGRCIGVVSAADFLQRACDEEGECREVTEVLTRDSPDEPFRVVPVREDTVERHMTPYVQTVTPETPLATACDEMVRLGVHRLIVCDAGGRPAGIVTALDALASLVVGRAAPGPK